MITVFFRLLIFKDSLMTGMVIIANHFLPNGRYVKLPTKIYFLFIEQRNAVTFQGYNGIVLRLF